MDNFLNIALMRNPLNWAIVFLMVALGSMLIFAILPPMQQRD